MPLRKYIGVVLAIIAYTIALIFMIPTSIATWFTIISNKFVCWSERKHIYNIHQTLLGIRLEDLRCIRCTKLIGSDDKSKAANEIVNMNLILDDIDRKMSAEQLINETRGNRQED